MRRYSYKTDAGARFILLGALVLVLTLVSSLYLIELNSTEPERLSPGERDIAVSITDSPLEESGGAYRAVIAMAATVPPFEEKHPQLHPRQSSCPEFILDSEVLRESANALIKEARELREAGQLERALEQATKAEELSPSQDVRRLILEIQGEIQVTAANEPASAAGSVK